MTAKEDPELVEFVRQTLSHPVAAQKLVQHVPEQVGPWCVLVAALTATSCEMPAEPECTRALRITLRKGSGLP